MSDAPDEQDPNARQWTGYWSMIVQQTQNAFNDKMAQFILIPLGGAVGLSIESAAGLMIALPFVLFAPIAGWLSDRFSKRDVLLGSAVLQLAVLLLICAALMIHNMPLALCGFFLLAMQSAFFSPAKLGINKELLGSKHLGFATGIQQMTAMLAMLAGQIVAAWLFDQRNHALGGTPETAWQAALGPLVALTACSVPTLILAWSIPRVPAQGGGPFTARLAVSHFANLADLWKDAPLRRASFGVAFFWGFVTYLNLWSIKVAKVMTHGGEGFGTISAIFMAFASIGMALGFGFASYLLRKRIELGWVPLAGLLMALLSGILSLVPPGKASDMVHLLDQNPLEFMVRAPETWLFLTLLGLLAFVSSLFLAPLNAWMQDRYPHDKRGELQSAVNLQDCLAGALTVIVITGFEWLAGTLRIEAIRGLEMQMMMVSFISLLAAGLILRMLPADVIRLLGTTVIRLIYPIRTVHPQRVPAKGGVLLLPNHVTFADAFYLATACNRPIRFVMDEVFLAKRSIRVFTAIFDTMTIRRDQPLEAIREIIRALKNGDVVCLFPEGQLTRTGTLCPLQRGFELIVRKSGHPVVPVWVDGSWGSVFSYEHNRFFSKRPRRMEHGITIAFGNSMKPESATRESMRHALMGTSALAIGWRFQNRKWLRRTPKAKHPAAKAMRALTEPERLRAWVNGHQIGMVNAVQRRSVIHVLKGDPVIHRLPGLLAAFPEMFHTQVRYHDVFDGNHNGDWVGGEYLCNMLQHTQITCERIVFYDFGDNPLQCVERAGVCHCPCLAVNGIVVSMSMPDPAPPEDDFAPQKGRKNHSLGKLLPGWSWADGDDGTIRIHGPAAPAAGLPLPAGSTLDDEGFLFERSDSPRRSGC